MSRRIISAIVVAALTIGLGACAPQPKPDDGEFSATLRETGDAIRVAVSPDDPLAIAVPGLGRITGPSGAFSHAGQMVVRLLDAASPETSFVTAAGPGVDVSFEGTGLVSPLTVFFDDPAVASALPGHGLPLVLHRPDGSPWEVQAFDYTPDGIPYIITDDFSPNLLGWIDIPSFLNDLGTWFGGGVTHRGCEGPAAPSWATLTGDHQLAHLCLISNTEQTSGAARAEIQVQSNRQHYQWVSVPPGNDYLWIADQPDLMRAVVGQLTGHDPSREVLLPEGGWFTAGYQQTTSYVDRNFRVYSDAWTVGFDALFEVLGLVPDTGGWTAILVLTAACKDFVHSGDSLELLKCAIETAAEQLSDPDKAFAAAMNLLGERAYAAAYQKQLQNMTSFLSWVGKAVKYVGWYVLGRSVFVRVLDWVGSLSNHGMGTFTLGLTAIQPAPVPESPPAQPNPSPPPATQPQQPAPPPPPSTTPRAWVTRSGGDITYHWENMPTGMWPEVDRFRCWRYTRTTHPGGWATDGCGQITGYHGYPSGTGSVTFSGVGATDSFSIEPWKYGPWLNVGESWTG